MYVGAGDFHIGEGNVPSRVSLYVEVRLFFFHSLYTLMSPERSWPSGHHLHVGCSEGLLSLLPGKEHNSLTWLLFQWEGNLERKSQTRDDS